MRNIALLFRVQLIGFLGVHRAFYSNDLGRRIRYTLLVCALFVVFVALFALFFFYCFALAFALNASNEIETLLAAVAAIASVLCFFSALFSAGAILFQSNDRDFIMALPVTEREIVFSKMLLLYLSSLFFSALALIPLCAAYTTYAKPSFLFYPLFVGMSLALPVLPTLVGCALSAFVRAITSRLKHAHLISAFLIIAATVALIVFVFSKSASYPTNLTEEQLTRELISQAANSAKAIASLYPPARLFAFATHSKNIFLCALFTGASVALFILCNRSIGKWLGALSMENSRRSAVRARGNTFITRTPFFAVYAKEARRYLSSAVYITNTAMGFVLCIVFAAFALFNRSLLVSQIEALNEFHIDLPPLLPFVVALCASLVTTPSMSLSLEGKSFPLLKSFPLAPMTIFRAKIAWHLTIALPSVILAMACIACALPYAPLDLVCLFLIPIGFVFLTAQWGMIANLLAPIFDWENEIKVIKQSAATLLGMIGVVPSLIGAACVLAFGKIAFWITPGALIIGCIGLSLALRVWGTKRFALL